MLYAWVESGRDGRAFAVSTNANTLATGRMLRQVAAQADARQREIRLTAYAFYGSTVWVRPRPLPRPSLWARLTAWWGW